MLNGPIPSDLGINVPYTGDNTVVNQTSGDNTPTVFGQINSIVQQGAKTAAQLVSTLNTFKGTTSTTPVTTTSTMSAGTKALVFIALIGAVVLVVYFAEKG